MNLPGLTLARSIASRSGSAAMIFVVAVVAVAAAVAGPTYYSAAQTSILRDNLDATPVLGRGYEVVQSGPVAGTIDSLESEVSGVVSAGLGSGHAAIAGRVFQPPIEALEASVFDPAEQQEIALVWRSGVCAHLVIKGTCPARAGQVMASSSLAEALGFRLGQGLTVPDWGRLTITGIYTPPTGGDYWFDRLGTYFTDEFPPGAATKSPKIFGVDALFAARATLEAAPSSVQGDDVIDDLLAEPKLRPGDVTPIENAVNGLLNSNELETVQAIPTSDVPSTMSSVTAAWSSLAVPVVLVSAQLLGLAWLLLLLLVTEESEARAGEVALAKLRGNGRVRTLVFGLSEPVALLAIALPVGAIVGWGSTILIAHELLRPGTPVMLPGLGWAAAGAAVAGGLLAVILASRRMLARPVVEQWRRSGRGATDRGWVVDAVLLTGAAAGLVDLLATGTVSSAHKSALALLVPGLLGLAVAVVASRLLPLACRSLTAGGRAAGGLGAYLALRHIARRPGGARTTIMLATSFSLATFAIAAWAVNEHNDTVLAHAQVGAPAVLDVATPQGSNLQTLVDRADPTGREAAAVEEFESNSMVTMAVDPARWAKVATWPGSRPGNVAGTLDPPEPGPVVLAGSAVRVSLNVTSLSPPGSTLVLDVDSPEGTATTPVQLGSPPPHGRFVATAGLPACPCLLQDLSVEPPPSFHDLGPPPKGEVTVTGIDVATGDVSWSHASAGLNDPARWQAPSASGALKERPGGGLGWSFASSNAGTNAVLAPVDRPTPLPAIAAAALTGGKTGPQTVAGVDGNNLSVDVASLVSSVPGSPSNGVVVDLAYANLAASGFVSPEAIDQVWVAGGDATQIAGRLQAMGVQILSTTTESGTKSLLGRQGPGLARVLFLAEAGAAAALAASGAILGLYLFARRRRYEYAALAVTGLRSRTLLGSLVAEQLIVIAFGLIVGIGTGLASVAVALRAVPEFLSVPPGPALSYLPPTGELFGLLLIIVGIVVAASIVASVALIRSVRLDQLREGPA